MLQTAVELLLMKPNCKLLVLSLLRCVFSKVLNVVTSPQCNSSVKTGYVTRHVCRDRHKRSSQKNGRNAVM